MKPDPTEIIRFLEALRRPGEVVELRALQVRQSSRTVTVSGYFDDLRSLATEAVKLTPVAAGVYVTLNTLRPEVLLRRRNRAGASVGKGTLTSDNDVERRSNILIDCDAVRLKGIPSTDGEHEAAISRACDIRHFLTNLGWPPPLLIDSGNGAHLVYRCDLPPDDSGLVKSLLKALSTAFSTAEVDIDESVASPGHLTKLCGTLARKGDDSAARPHRLAKILESPGVLESVSDEQIITVLSVIEAPTGDRKSNSALVVDVEDWLGRAGMTHGPGRPWNGGTLWELDICPWNPEHDRREAWIAQFPSGALAAGCHHNSCRDRRWRDLKALIEPDRTVSADGENGTDEPGKRSQASQLVEMVLNSGAELFHTPAGDGYMTAFVDSHCEVLPLKSGRAGQLLRLVFYRNTGGKAAGAQVVTDAMNVLRSKAVFDGPELPVSVRLSQHQDDIYLDLGDATWSAVRINRNGWEVIAEPPVRFRRAKGILALPVPRRGGRISDLRRFVNVANDDDFRLMTTVLVTCFFPSGPFPVVLLQGEQGSAKSTTARVLVELLDAAVPALRAQPREGRDLMIAANNRWLLSFDNMSDLPAWLSDALCRLATGGGFSTRELWTDDDEALFDAQRPVILTGIEDLVARSDLLDRTILFLLPHISEEARQTETQFWAKFQEARPFLLGSILDCLVETLRALPDTDIKRLPRLADFAKRGAALAPSLGWTAEEFLSIYEDNRHSGHVTAIEASSVAQAVVLLMERVAAWSGTASELLEALNQVVTEDKRKAKNWPRNPRGMSGALRRIVPNLREMNILVEFVRATGKDRSRQIEIKRGIPPSEPSAASDTESAVADANDAALKDRPPFASDILEPEMDRSDDTDGRKPALSQPGLWRDDPSDPTPCKGCGDHAPLRRGLCGRCRRGDAE